MTRLEDLRPHATVRGILPDTSVTVVSVEWFGSDVLELTYKDSAGRVGQVLLYRDDEPRLKIVEAGRPRAFDGDGALFRLVSEAHRIRLAYLFDPLLAVHTSLLEPLPHQVTAVYEAMLPRQPLRFLLADDPGAGKTIMAGLLIKELLVRGDLQRFLVVCPGSLVEQWQDELYRRFQLPFEIMTNDKLEAARTGNWFLETHLVIARLDKSARDETVQAKLAAPDCRWDLVVVDEAHKMSAHFFGGEVERTKRYKLGQLLSGLTRHFLLLTATPHNGKEEDFQFFLALLDGDRFEGRFRDGVHQVDVSDLMRRMVKERLVKFDGTPLFPERIAYTVPYRLSDPEAHLYKEVTDYVREEFNRAEALEDDRRAGTVGFALTILQRRLASSPEAIYQSLRRRRERLESRLRELGLLRRGAMVPAPAALGPALDAEDLADLEEAPDDELAQKEEEILDQATAARTIEELKAEIGTLKRLEALAQAVRRSGEDRKWRELAALLAEIFTPAALPGRVAEQDHGDQPRLLFYLEHAIQDASRTAAGERRVISRRMLYVELSWAGTVRHSNYAPYLDYRPLREDEPAPETILARPECAWITRDLEARALGYAVTHVVPEHLDEVRRRRLEWIEKARAAVKERLTKEIAYWDHRAEALRLQEQAGKVNARLNSQEARRRADELAARLQKRMEQLELEAQISPLPPVVLGGVVVVPLGLLAKMTGQSLPGPQQSADTQAVAARARAIVMDLERRLGFEPADREAERLGYDLESRDPRTGRLRFIEVKGRITGADTVTVTKNEILTSLNKPDDYILAIVEFLDGGGHRVHYVRRPFRREPDFGVTSVNYDLRELLARAEVVPT